MCDCYTEHDLAVEISDPLHSKTGGHCNEE